MAEHYQGLDRGELLRQGADHLEGRAEVRVGRLRRLLWQVVITGLVLGVLGTAGLILWTLHLAHRSGQHFAEVRQQVLEAYGVDGDAEPVTVPGGPPRSPP